MTADTYHCVLTFTYGGGPIIADSGPKSLDEAMAEFDRHVASAEFGKYRRAKVISDYEWRKVQPQGGAE